MAVPPGGIIPHQISLVFFPHLVALAATGETLDPVAEEAAVVGGGG